MSRYYTDELYHYGVPGMKWGVRRYQNADGTLTNAGKKRYSVDMGESGKEFTNIEKIARSSRYTKQQNAKRSAYESGRQFEIDNKKQFHAQTKALDKEWKGKINSEDDWNKYTKEYGKIENAYRHAKNPYKESVMKIVNEWADQIYNDTEFKNNSYDEEQTKQFIRTTLDRYI